MVDCLVDTNILVDFLRNHPPALAWKASVSNITMGISSIVYMEIIQGAVDKIYMQRALKFLTQFPVVHLTIDDHIWAMNEFAKYKLSYNVDLTDALIAAPVHRLNLPFYTRNTKHFLPMIPNLLNQPY